MECELKGENLIIFKDEMLKGVYLEYL